MITDTFTLFAVEVAFSLLVSLGVIALLGRLLKIVLRDTCGADHRAEFWLLFSKILLLVCPLMLVVAYAPNGAFDDINFLQELQQLIFRILLGVFVALVVVGRMILKTIAPEFNQAAAQTITEGK